MSETNVKSRFSPILRSIALALVISFGASEVAHAAPGAVNIFSEPLASNPALLKVSPSYAKVHDVYTGHSGKLLIHIQDAHANLSAQDNLAKTLDELIARYKIKTVFVEGGTKDDSLTFLRPLASAENRQRVAKKYLMKNELSGAEYLNLASDRDFSLWGVEQKSLYDKNLATYAKVAKNREAVLAYIAEITKRVESLKRRLFSADMLAFDEAVKKFEMKDMAYTEFEAMLSARAKEAGVPMQLFNNFNALGSIKAMEDKIDFEKATAEQEVLFGKVMAKAGAEAEGLAVVKTEIAKMKSGGSTPLSFFETLFALAKESGISTGEYRELGRYIDYLKAYSKIDLFALIDETRAVQEAVYKASLTDPETYYLHGFSEYLNGLNKLFSLQASTEDYEAYKARQSDMRYEIVPALSFINKKLADLDSISDVIKYEPLVENNRADVEDFYETTKDRDQIFIEKAVQRMTDDKSDIAVLITGGYHTPHLKELMERRGFSYAVVTPNIAQETNIKKYEEILLGQLGNGAPKETQLAFGKTAEALAFAAAAERGVTSRVAAELSAVGQQTADRRQQTGARLAAKKPAEKDAGPVERFRKGFNDLKRKLPGLSNKAVNEVLDGRRDAPESEGARLANWLTLNYWFKPDRYGYRRIAEPIIVSALLVFTGAVAYLSYRAGVEEHQLRTARHEKITSLVLQLRDTIWQKRVDAASQLGLIGTEREIPVLEVIVATDPIGAVSEAASTAILNIKDRTDGARLAESVSFDATVQNPDKNEIMEGVRRIVDETQARVTVIMRAGDSSLVLSKDSRAVGVSLGAVRVREASFLKVGSTVRVDIRGGRRLTAPQISEMKSRITDVMGTSGARLSTLSEAARYVYVTTVRHPEWFQSGNGKLDPKKVVEYVRAEMGAQASVSLSDDAILRAVEANQNKPPDPSEMRAQRLREDYDDGGIWGARLAEERGRLIFRLGLGAVAAIAALLVVPVQVIIPAFILWAGYSIWDYATRSTRFARWLERYSPSDEAAPYPAFTAEIKKLSTVDRSRIYPWVSNASYIHPLRPAFWQLGVNENARKKIIQYLFRLGIHVPRALALAPYASLGGYDDISYGGYFPFNRWIAETLGSAPAATPAAAPAPAPAAIAALAAAASPSVWTGGASRADEIASRYHWETLMNDDAGSFLGARLAETSPSLPKMILLVTGAYTAVVAGLAAFGVVSWRAPLMVSLIFSAVIGFMPLFSLAEKSPRHPRLLYLWTAFFSFILPAAGYVTNRIVFRNEIAAEDRQSAMRAARHFLGFIESAERSGPAGVERDSAALSDFSEAVGSDEYLRAFSRANADKPIDRGTFTGVIFDGYHHAHVVAGHGPQRAVYSQKQDTMAGVGFMVGGLKGLAAGSLFSTNSLSTGVLDQVFDGPIEGYVSVEDMKKLAADGARLAKSSNPAIRFLLSKEWPVKHPVLWEQGYAGDYSSKVVEGSGRLSMKGSGPKLTVSRINSPNGWSMVGPKTFVLDLNQKPGEVLIDLLVMLAESGIKIERPLYEETKKEAVRLGGNAARLSVSERLSAAYRTLASAKPGTALDLGNIDELIQMHEISFAFKADAPAPDGQSFGRETTIAIFQAGPQWGIRAGNVRLQLEKKADGLYFHFTYKVEREGAVHGEWHSDNDKTAERVWDASERTIEGVPSVSSRTPSTEPSAAAPRDDSDDIERGMAGRLYPNGARLALKTIDPTTTPAWAVLKQLAERLKGVHTNDLFKTEGQRERAKRFTRIFRGSGKTKIAVDYSMNHINSDVMRELGNLAEQTELGDAISKMFGGKKVNRTENRAGLHIALRAPADSVIMVDGVNVVPHVHEVLEHMREYSDGIRSGRITGYTGKRIRNVVNFGIGGSDLGPKKVSRALKPLATGDINVYYVSNVDPADFYGQVIASGLDPEETVFMVASKTFTTRETKDNAAMAKDWFIKTVRDKFSSTLQGDALEAKVKEAIRSHFIALSTNTAEVEAFGIDKANMFGFWDWVGGRYSLWSAIGLSTAIYVGFDKFEEMLEGAHEMDEHFRNTPFADNIPVILALIDIWNMNFQGHRDQLVMPYAQDLELMPDYLQQLVLESLGKRVGRDDKPVSYQTTMWWSGTPGTNGQHSYKQARHQGVDPGPTEYIAAANTAYPQYAKGHRTLLANMLAQAEALLVGRSASDPHNEFPGGAPSQTIILDRLSPRTLGALLSLYEHRVYTVAAILNIFALNQPGVELGKKLTPPAENLLAGTPDGFEHDGSTVNKAEIIREFQAEGARLALTADALEARYGKRLQKNDESVVDEIDALGKSLTDTADQRALYEWLQTHDSALSADAIAKVGFNWSGAVPRLAERIDGIRDGNPKAAARQLVEIVNKGTFGGLTAPEDVRREAIAAYGSRKERVDSLVPYITLPELPALQAPKPGLLVLERHGETNWAEARLNKWAGWYNAVLTVVGVINAFLAGVLFRVLRIDNAYTSDLIRSGGTMLETQRGRGQMDFPVSMRKELRERDYGDMIGWRRTLVEAVFGSVQYKKWRRGKSGDDVRPPGGENLDDVQERTLPLFITEIMTKIAQGKNVLVALHGNSGRAILSYLRALTKNAALTEEEVLGIEIPLSTPIIVKFDNVFKHDELWVKQSQGAEEAVSKFALAAARLAITAENEAELLRTYEPALGQVPPVSDNDKQLIREMVRDYDYRSRSRDDLSPAAMFMWGVTQARMALDRKRRYGVESNEVLIAKDARKVKKELLEAFVAGILHEGLNVRYISADGPNAVTSYSWAVREFKPLMSVFYTSSHVVADTLKDDQGRDTGVFEKIMGMKTSIVDDSGELTSLTTKEIKEESYQLIQSAVSQPWSKANVQIGKISTSNVDVNTSRQNRIVGLVAAISSGDITLQKLDSSFADFAKATDWLAHWEGILENVIEKKPFDGMKIVIDAAHTPSGYLAATPFRELGADAVVINEDIQEVDGAHKADPSKSENLIELKKRMIAENAQMGLAFDLDGDRGAIVVRVGDGVDLEKDFTVLPPDNLMAAMIPFLRNEGGYDGEKVAFVRDVLSTEGVDVVASAHGAESHMTDAGYVFLKERSKQLRKQGYRIPMMGERSGHAWTSVTGSYENPVAVALIFAAMAKRHKEKNSASKNAFIDVFNANTVPYKQSVRFQPLFGDEFLKKLEKDPRNDTGWSLKKGKPNQKIIAIGRDVLIRTILDVFRPGTSFRTVNNGRFVVDKVVAQDPQTSPDGFYRYADIKFLDEQGLNAGRFVIRASSNDPTWVASFETPVRAGESFDSPAVLERYSALAGIVLGYLDAKDFANAFQKGVKKPGKDLSDQAALIEQFRSKRDLEIAKSSQRQQWLNEAARIFNLQPTDVAYLGQMWDQYMLRAEAGSKERLVIGNNFLIGATLNSEEREKLLGAFNYLAVKADPKNAEAAKNVVITASSMDGGIGESLDRRLFLKKMIELGLIEPRALKDGLPVMTAKGTDLGYELRLKGRTVFVSIAEAKLFGLIAIARALKFAGMKFQPLVNHQSLKSYLDLLDHTPYLEDKLEGVAAPRSYRQALNEAGVEVLTPLLQADLPGIEVDSGSVANPSASKQPGGHGQWGFKFLYESYTNPEPQDGRTHIRVFYNGDNINSRVSEHIAGRVALKNEQGYGLPIVKVTTAAKRIDKKGGKDGLRVIKKNGRELHVPDQMEKADAALIGPDHLQTFYDAGQPGSKLVEKGPQPFNTNIFYINNTVLDPIVAELVAVLEQRLGSKSAAEAEFARIISPTRISKDAKNGFLPIDGAIGTAMHNLNAYFMTSDDPLVKDILTKRGLDRLLFFVDIPRTEFFTPVKNPFDMHLQRSDYYRLNPETMLLEDHAEGISPPEFSFLDAEGKEIEKGDAYWNEYQNVADAFGASSFRQLRGFAVHGVVKLANAVLDGEVRLINRTGTPVDMNDPVWREKLAVVFPDGVLTLRNVSVTFEKNGQVVIVPFGARLASKATLPHILIAPALWLAGMLRHFKWAAPFVVVLLTACGGGGGSGVGSDGVLRFPTTTEETTDIGFDNPDANVIPGSPTVIELPPGGEGRVTIAAGTIPDKIDGVPVPPERIQTAICLVPVGSDIAHGGQIRFPTHAELVDNQNEYDASTETRGGGELPLGDYRGFVWFYDNRGDDDPNNDLVMSPGLYAPQIIRITSQAGTQLPAPIGTLEHPFYGPVVVWNSPIPIVLPPGTDQSRVYLALTRTAAGQNVPVLHIPYTEIRDIVENPNGFSLDLPGIPGVTGPTQFKVQIVEKGAKDSIIKDLGTKNIRYTESLVARPANADLENAGGDGRVLLLPHLSSGAQYKADFETALTAKLNSLSIDPAPSLAALHQILPEQIQARYTEIVGGQSIQPQIFRPADDHDALERVPLDLPVLPGTFSIRFAVMIPHTSPSPEADSNSTKSAFSPRVLPDVTAAASVKTIGNRAGILVIDVNTLKTTDRTNLLDHVQAPIGDPSAVNASTMVINGLPAALDLVFAGGGKTATIPIALSDLYQSNGAIPFVIPADITAADVSLGIRSSVADMKPGAVRNITTLHPTTALPFDGTALPAGSLQLAHGAGSTGSVLLADGAAFGGATDSNAGKIISYMRANGFPNFDFQPGVNDDVFRTRIIVRDAGGTPVFQDTFPNARLGNGHFATDIRIPKAVLEARGGSLTGRVFANFFFITPKANPDLDPSHVATDVIIPFDKADVDLGEMTFTLPETPLTTPSNFTNGGNTEAEPGDPTGKAKRLRVDDIATDLAAMKAAVLAATPGKTQPADSDYSVFLELFDPSDDTATAAARHTIEISMSNVTASGFVLIDPNIDPDAVGTWKATISVGVNGNGVTKTPGFTRSPRNNPSNSFTIDGARLATIEEALRSAYEALSLRNEIARSPDDRASNGKQAAFIEADGAYRNAALSIVRTQKNESGRLKAALQAKLAKEPGEKGKELLKEYIAVIDTEVTRLGRNGARLATAETVIGYAREWSREHEALRYFDDAIARFSASTPHGTIDTEVVMLEQNRREAELRRDMNRRLFREGFAALNGADRAKVREAVSLMQGVEIPEGARLANIDETVELVKAELKANDEVLMAEFRRDETEAHEKRIALVAAHTAAQAAVEALRGTPDAAVLRAQLTALGTDGNRKEITGRYIDSLTSKAEALAQARERRDMFGPFDSGTETDRMTIDGARLASETSDQLVERLAKEAFTNKVPRGGPTWLDYVGQIEATYTTASSDFLRATNRQDAALRLESAVRRLEMPSAGIVAPQFRDIASDFGISGARLSDTAREKRRAAALAESKSIAAKQIPAVEAFNAKLAANRTFTSTTSIPVTISANFAGPVIVDGPIFVSTFSGAKVSIQTFNFDTRALEALSEQTITPAQREQAAAAARLATMTTVNSIQDIRTHSALEDHLIDSHLDQLESDTSRMVQVIISRNWLPKDPVHAREYLDHLIPKLREIQKKPYGQNVYFVFDSADELGDYALEHGADVFLDNEVRRTLDKRYIRYVNLGPTYAAAAGHRHVLVEQLEPGDIPSISAIRIAIETGRLDLHNISDHYIAAVATAAHADIRRIDTQAVAQQVQGVLDISKAIFIQAVMRVKIDEALRFFRMGARMAAQAA